MPWGGGGGGRETEVQRKYDKRIRRKFRKYGEDNRRLFSRARTYVLCGEATQILC